MGSASKIILIGATSLIIGIYAVSLKTVQTNDIGTALVDVKRVQFERMQAAAVSSAMSAFVSYGATDSLSGTRNALGGGTFSYKFISHVSSWYWDGWSWNPIYDYSTLTLTATLDGVPRTITARVENTSLRSDPAQRYIKQGSRKLHRATWEMTKYYVQREH